MLFRSAECSGKVSIIDALRRFAIGASALGCTRIPRHAFTEFDDDARGEPPPHSRRRCEERFIAVDQRAADPIGAMSREEGKRYLRANAAHIEKCREEALLVATAESDKLLGIFADQVVEVEFDVRSLMGVGNHLRKDANPQSDSLSHDHEGIFLHPGYLTREERVHQRRSARSVARTARSKPLSAAIP